MLPIVVHAWRLFPGAFLCLTILTSRLCADTLSLDFNDRSTDLPGNTQEDFDSFILANVGGSTAVQMGTNVLNYGRVTVSISDLAGSGCDDRKRSTPVTNATFSDAQLLQDSIFPAGSSPTNGLNIRIQGLGSNQNCQVTI